MRPRGAEQSFTINILSDDLNEGTEFIKLSLTTATGSPDLGTIVSIPLADPFTLERVK